MRPGTAGRRRGRKRRADAARAAAIRRHRRREGGGGGDGEGSTTGDTDDLPVVIYGVDMNITNLCYIATGSALACISATPRLKRLLAHQRRMRSDLDQARVKRRRRRRLHRRCQLMARKLSAIVRSMHQSAITYMLRPVRLGRCRAVICLPPLDPEATARADNTVLTSHSRTMWKVQQHGAFLARLQAAVDELGPSRAILRLDARDDYR